MRVCSASRVARHTITRKHPAAPPPLVAPPHTVSRSNHVATAFRRTPGCEVLVYYPIEKRQLRALQDLHTFAKTAPDAQTRAYLTTLAAAARASRHQFRGESQLPRRGRAAPATGLHDAFAPEPATPRRTCRHKAPAHTVHLRCCRVFGRDDGRIDCVAGSKKMPRRLWRARRLQDGVRAGDRRVCCYRRCSREIERRDNEFV